MMLTVEHTYKQLVCPPPQVHEPSIPSYVDTSTSLHRHTCFPSTPVRWNVGIHAYVPTHFHAFILITWATRLHAYKPSHTYTCGYVLLRNCTRTRIRTSIPPRVHASMRPHALHTFIPQDLYTQHGYTNLHIPPHFDTSIPTYLDT